MLVRWVEKRPEIADRHGLDRVRPQPPHRNVDTGFVQRDDDFAFDIDALLDLVDTPPGHQRVGRALGAESQFLVRDHLRNRETVVDFGKVHVIGLNAGHAIRDRAGLAQRRPTDVIGIQPGDREPVHRLTGAGDEYRRVGQVAGAILAVASMTAAAPSVMGQHMNRRSGAAIMHEQTISSA